MRWIPCNSHFETAPVGAGLKVTHLDRDALFYAVRVSGLEMGLALIETIVDFVLEVHVPSGLLGHSGNDPLGYTGLRRT